MPEHKVIFHGSLRDVPPKDLPKTIGATQDDFISLLLQGVEKYRRGEIPKKDKEERTCGQVAY